MAAPIFLPFVLLSFWRSAQENTHHHSMLEGVPSGKTRVLDLSYAINDKLVPWPGDEKFFEATVNDAPAHFPPGKTTVDQIPAKQLFGPAVVIDVRAESGKNADYQLGASRVEEWEERHGRIPEGAIVLLRTGWASRWPDARKYRNQDAKGKMHFPGFSAEAAKLLIQRRVSGLGCDTLSIDHGASSDYPVHHVALGAGLYQLENLADLSELPERGAFLIVAPIKLEGGSGGPVRVFALLP
ncbi:MAG: cyclase [Acidobacteria bacterium]|nr:MAG: cyclase [Acidobacteriota bacterium]